MTIERAKEVIGEKYWNEFWKWMRGQTVGVNDDGSIDIYDYDVERFLRYKKRRFRETSFEWD